jgi:hypothetical protein
VVEGIKWVGSAEHSGTYDRMTAAVDLGSSTGTAPFGREGGRPRRTSSRLRHTPIADPGRATGAKGAFRT